jgi:hypothetical protein
VRTRGVTYDADTDALSASVTFCRCGLTRDAHQGVDDLRDDGWEIPWYRVLDADAAFEDEWKEAIDEAVVALEAIDLESLVVDDLVGDVGSECIWI